MPEVRVIGKLNLLPRALAADLLGVTVRTLVNWQRDRRGPPVSKLGRKAYYEQSALERWIEKSIAKAERAE
jgi:hypothetical protein